VDKGDGKSGRLGEVDRHGLAVQYRE
jgi:hypothetical protein